MRLQMRMSLWMMTVQNFGMSITLMIIRGDRHPWTLPELLPVHNTGQIVVRCACVQKRTKAIKDRTKHLPT